MVEGNGKTTLVGGITGKGFLPGQSGNPGGRPKGLAAFIREQTQDGQELAKILLAVARGEEKAFCKWSDKLKAIEMLLDRGGWAKSPILDGSSGAPLPVLDLSTLTAEEIVAFEQFGLVLASIRQRVTSGTAEAQP